jgi:hypothetical protein
VSAAGTAAASRPAAQRRKVWLFLISAAMPARCSRVPGSFWMFINSINYLWSFGIGFVVYLILMQTSLKGKSFVTEEEHEAFTERAA